MSIIPIRSKAMTPVGAVVAGLAAAAVGTLAMDLTLFARYKRDGGKSGFRDWELSAEVESWDQAPAPAQVGKRLVEGLFQIDLPDRYAALVNNITHWGYGVIGGAPYGIVVGSLHKPRVSFGLLLNRLELQLRHPARRQALPADLGIRPQDVVQRPRCAPRLRTHHGRNVQGAVCPDEAINMIRDPAFNHSPSHPSTPVRDSSGPTLADFVVATLRASGVRRIYGLPGDSLNGLTDAIRRDGEMTWLHVRHEEAAAFAAAGEAAVTGGLAVCAASCGPGNLHLINGLYDAQRSRVPVLALAAHIPLSEVGSGYFQETRPLRPCRDRRPHTSPGAGHPADGHLPPGQGIHSLGNPKHPQRRRQGRPRRRHDQPPTAHTRVAACHRRAAWYRPDQHVRLDDARPLGVAQLSGPANQGGGRGRPRAQATWPRG